MKRSDAPKKQPVPFGINGPRENLLPTTPSGDNTASYDQGFPPVTMILKAAGGLPPKGQDMNQILYELSNLSRWTSTGAINSFDASFASSIGGYPKASVLISDDGETIFINSIDGNKSNPDAGGDGWVNLSNKYLNRNNPFGDIKSDGNVGTAKSNLGLSGFNTNQGSDPGIFSSMTSPNGKFDVFVTNDGQWGTQNKSGQSSPLTVGRGGTGSTTQEGARSNLGLGSAATKNVGFGTGQIPDMSGFTTGPGWAKLPNGKILQWIQISTSTSAAVQSSFPIVFPSGPHMVCASATDVNNPNFVSAAVFNNVTFLVTAHNASGARVATNVFVYAIGE